MAGKKRLAWRTCREWPHYLDEYLLTLGGRQVAIVTRDTSRTFGDARPDQVRWYWYTVYRGDGPRHNSLWHKKTYATADEAKAACKSFLAEWAKGVGKLEP